MNYILILENKIYWKTIRHLFLANNYLHNYDHQTHPQFTNHKIDYIASNQFDLENHDKYAKLSIQTYVLHDTPQTSMLI